jgi:uncharacterized protein (TIGR00290 family)
MGGQGAWLSWSSGKDSAWTLFEMRRSGSVEIAALLTTITEPFERVSMHGVRLSLLEAQAASVGLPLVKVPIPFPCSNEQYAARMKAAMERALSEGISAMIFGDLYLEDVRRYREENLRPLGMQALFPLWGMETKQLAERMIDAGLHAIVTCLDPRKVPRELAGRPFDRNFLAALPPGVDPCAERGEFHTVAIAGPMFSHPIAVAIGETVERDGFVFTDVTPTASSPHR